MTQLSLMVGSSTFTRFVQTDSSWFIIMDCLHVVWSSSQKYLTCCYVPVHSEIIKTDEAISEYFCLFLSQYSQ